jgi:glucose repression mediator protein
MHICVPSVSTFISLRYAYAHASELDPSNHVISQCLQILKNAQATGGQLPAAPGPQDVHPTAYASAVVPPPGLTHLLA